MFRRLGKTDRAYQEQIAGYGRKDGLLAVVVWIAVMAVYYAMGQLYAAKGVYLGVYVNSALVVLCLALVLIRKEKPASIGLTRVKAVKSIVVGCVLGVIIVGANNAMNMVQGRSLAPLHDMALDFVYYMAVISLAEEVIFRGYIQTRLYGLVKNPVAAIMLGGIFFMLMHIPFQMGYAQMGWLAYIQLNSITLILTFFWHILFDFLYRKYNTIYTPAIFHGFLNWSNHLFL